MVSAQPAAVAAMVPAGYEAHWVSGTSSAKAGAHKNKPAFGIFLAKLARMKVAAHGLSLVRAHKHFGNKPAFPAFNRPSPLKRQGQTTRLWQLRLTDSVRKLFSSPPWSTAAFRSSRDSAGYRSQTDSATASDTFLCVRQKMARYEKERERKKKSTKKAQPRLVVESLARQRHVRVVALPNRFVKHAITLRPPIRREIVKVAV
jgi:hypothetical protein